MEISIKGKYAEAVSRALRLAANEDASEETVRKHLATIKEVVTNHTVD